MNEVEVHKRGWNLMGPNNPSWSGNTPTYRALHKWVRRHIEKLDICPCCEEKIPTDCANYTGIYDRNLDNYVFICRPCHQKLDFMVGDRAKIYGRKWWGSKGD